MAKLTKPQRARLDKLATYLERLPKRYRHFDMDQYIVSDDAEKVSQYALHNGGVPSCGTVACAVGHGPAAGILFKKEMVTRYSSGGWRVDWNAYSTLFLPADPLSEGRWSDERLFDWLFGDGWSLSDNHHYGAAARIRYLLAEGQPPAGFAKPGRAHQALYAPYRIDAKAPANA
jgi:hypothetical protein